MSYLTEFMSHPALLHLGTWLLHFTWQAGLLGLLWWIVQPALRRQRAHVRYTSCWIVLALTLLFPTFTMVYSNALEEVQVNPVDQPAVIASPDTQQAALSNAPVLQENPAKVLHLPAVVSKLYLLRPYFVLLWLLGVLMFASTFRRGLAHTYLLKTSGTLCREDTIDRMSRRIADQLGVLQRVVVRITDKIDQPVLIGWLKPVILLPAGLLSGLTPQQLEAILTHELAHVKRHDYALSVVQSIFETLFFFHPVVWWISNQITIEREFCCDDLAVQAMGSKTTYLRALVALETLRTTGLTASPALSIHDGSLLSRVQRLAIPSASSPTPITQSRITLMFVISLVLSFFVWLPGTLSTAGEVPPTTQVTPIATLQSVALNDSIPSLHPLKSRAKVTSGFGMRYHPLLKEKRMHKGIDFMARMGTDVYATAAGTIKTVTEDDGYGMYIDVEHADGYETRYSNLSRQVVKEGQSIAKGEKIGESGNSGLSTAPHLHYEVRRNAKPIDPVDYLPSALLGQFDDHDTPSGHPLGDTKIRPTATFGMRHHPVLKIRRMHAGLDFLTERLTPVYATANGEVQVTAQNTGMGKHVKIYHNSGLTTVYGHLSEIAVEAGQHIKKGELLGRSGNTGLSTAPHLHYEIRTDNRKPLDPLYFLPEETIALSLGLSTQASMD